MTNYLMKKMNHHLPEVGMTNYLQVEVPPQVEVPLLVGERQLRVVVEEVQCLLVVELMLPRMLPLHLLRMMPPHLQHHLLQMTQLHLLLHSLHLPPPLQRHQMLLLPPRLMQLSPRHLLRLLLLRPPPLSLQHLRLLLLQLPVLILLRRFVDKGLRIHYLPMFEMHHY
jgi:hypothetical protein